MKMKKENMDHIRALVEKETGTVLPEKKSFDLAPYAGRIVAAAAGIICLVGLGLIWHGISEKKQNEEGAVLSAEESLTEQENTEDSGEASQEQQEADVSGENGEDVTEADIDVVDLDDVDGKKYSVSVYMVDAGAFAFLVYSELPDGSFSKDEIFGADEDWVWPVESRPMSVIEPDPEPWVKKDSVLVMSNKDGYLSFPGQLGELVMAMHLGIVTDCGFDMEKGNYITTDFKGNIIEYRHLDEIFVSVGDEVKAGDRIGTLGNSGRSTGPHLGIMATAPDGSVITVVAVSEIFDEEGVLIQLGEDAELEIRQEEDAEGASGEEAVTEAEEVDE